MNWRDEPITKGELHDALVDVKNLVNAEMMRINNHIETHKNSPTFNIGNVIAYQTDLLVFTAGIPRMLAERIERGI